ncbi:hypothetical protein L209DRAFT_534432 [Thermothelomyces heterothallicus CBS 203.75]
MERVITRGKSMEYGTDGLAAEPLPVLVPLCSSRTVLHMYVCMYIYVVRTCTNSCPCGSGVAFWTPPPSFFFFFVIISFLFGHGWQRRLLAFWSPSQPVGSFELSACDS